MRARIEQELTLLRKYYPEIEHKEHGGEDWFHLPRYPFPSGWMINETAISEAPIVFKIVASYPTGEPYGFAAPAGINFTGQAPQNTGSPVKYPFEGSWQHFSWAPVGWEPTSEPYKGSNLLIWVRSFTNRLKEGA
ncbi:MAG: hypothetical protein KC643_23150 [Nitrospira sp.]|nr:hypothetical protein [Nitrospira sp.]